MLRTRIITALVLLAVLLPALFYADPTPFGIVALVMIAAAAWEWGRLSQMGQPGACALALVAAALCAAMWQAGWLVRHPTDKTYRLGPALVRAGRAAAPRSPLVDHAHPTMHALAQEVDAHCLLLEDVGDSLVILDAASPRGRPLAPLSVGQSFPMRAPFGGMFVFWRDDEAFDAWVADEDAEAFGRARAVAVDAGFEVRVEPPIDVVELRSRLGDTALVEEVRRMLGQVDQLTSPLVPGESYRVVLVSAPIGRSDHALSLSFRSGAVLSGAAVQVAGAAVRRAAEELAHLV